MDPTTVDTYYFYQEPIRTKAGNYIRVAIFSIDFIHCLAESSPLHVIEGIHVKVWGKKIKCFKQKGIICPRCNRRASFYALEKDAYQSNPDKYHLNLYGVGKKGEFMFTADHIFPWSKGGSGRQENLQPMCAKCNSHKGNKVPKKFQYTKLDGGKVIPIVKKEENINGRAA